MLKAALDLVLEVGFRGVSIEGIAARTGVGKTTLYRRWPNKAAVVMEAFLSLLEPISLFPEHERATERLRLQMQTTGKAFRGRVGALVRALWAEAQFDAELARAFRDSWTLPRRRLVHAVLEEAIRQGGVRVDIDLEAAIDAFYAPLYYRLQMGTGVISEAYIDTVFEQAMEGQKGSKARRPSSRGAASL
ncbi:Transcriptional regulator, TetR family [Granulicella sibirica]|uniref:Transcriptional regulator, TetR family n=2 Tax=Granulicella sibirica TaxID=2479048 RepID=A0A4Q0T4D1_9BACT|nr:Transcriptional regulator, TetR family [Granulicella sibirica]